jgi:hypothetical protein
VYRRQIEISPFPSLLLLDGLRRLGQSLHLEPLCRLKERGKLVLGHVNLPGVHELEDGGQMLEGDVLQDDDRVLRRVLLKQGLEAKYKIN